MPTSELSVVLLVRKFSTFYETGMVIAVFAGAPY
jgi:hypothetical protein